MSRRKDGTFSRADFTYDKDRDLYICPNGKELKTSGANDEFLLAATVQNLRRLAKLAAIPPPIPKAA